MSLLTCLHAAFTGPWPWGILLLRTRDAAWGHPPQGPCRYPKGVHRQEGIC